MPLACCFHKKPGGALVHIMKHAVCYLEDDGTGGTFIRFNAVIDSDTLATLNVQESMVAVVQQLR